MNEINVIYQFNEKYVPYAGVSMTSLLVNNADADTVNIYVLGEELPEGAKKTLEDNVSSFGSGRSIFFPDTAPLLSKFEELGMIPYRGAYSVYLRLFFTLIPEVDLSGKRVIYLDADTIVDGTLLPLVNIDLEGKSIGMVLESIRDDYKVMIGMDRGSDYYNSGVILFDVDRWVENRYCDRLLDHIRNVRSSYIGDQDFLNIVCEGDVLRLSPKYNYQPLHRRYTIKQYFDCYGQLGYYNEKEISDNPVIYHCYRWLGEFPWNIGNLHPFCAEFDKYMAQSPWKDYKKEKAENGAAIRVEKILYRLLPPALFIRVFRIFHEMMLKRAEHDARSRKTNVIA